MLILSLRANFKATRAVCAYALKQGLKIAVLLACGLLMQFLRRVGSLLNLDVACYEGKAFYVEVKLLHRGKAVITVHYLG